MLALVCTSLIVVGRLPTPLRLGKYTPRLGARGYELPRKGEN